MSWALLITAVALMASLLGAGTAGAEVSKGTVLCKAAEESCKESNRYGSGTVVESELKSGTKWSIEASYGTPSCTGSLINGSLTGSGGVNRSVPVSLSAVAFSGCNGTMQAESLPWQGNITRTEGGSGTLHITAMKLHTKISTIFGNVNCYYGGPVDFAFNGGNPSELVATKANLTALSGSNALCEEKSQLTASFTNTAPKPAYVELPEVGTVLCSASEEPCPSATRYPVGTEITATSTNATFEYSFTNLKCSQSKLKAKIEPSALGQPVTAKVTEYTFYECGAATETISKGSLNIYEYGDGTKRGAITQSGFELKQTVKTPGGNINCLFTGAAGSPSFTEAGGVTLLPGSSAEIKFDHQNMHPLPTSTFCNGVTLTGNYTVSSPSPLYVSYG